MININVGLQEKEEIKNKHYVFVVSMVFEELDMYLNDIGKKKGSSSAGGKYDLYKKIIENIITNLKTFAIGELEELIKIVQYDETKLKCTYLMGLIEQLTLVDKKELHKKLKEIFKYSRFSNLGESGYESIISKELKECKSKSAFNNKFKNKNGKEFVSYLIQCKNCVDILIKKHAFDEAWTQSIINIIDEEIDFFKKNESQLVSKYYKVRIDSFYNKINDYFKWSPAEYIKLLDLNTCPYCNRQYLTFINDEKKRYKPDLDHFIGKARLPMFGLSIFNLVPSCKVCNQSMKRSKAFVKVFKNEVIIDPYEVLTDNVISFKEDERNKMGYTLKIHKENPFFADFIYPCVNPWDELISKEIVFETIIDTHGKRIPYINRGNLYGKYLLDDDRFLYNIEAFNIDRAYKIHGDVIDELYGILGENSLDYIEGQKKLMDDLGIVYGNDEMFYRLIFNNYYNENDHKKRVLAKLVKDIACELDIEKCLF